MSSKLLSLAVIAAGLLGVGAYALTRPDAPALDPTAEAPAPGKDSAPPLATGEVDPTPPPPPTPAPEDVGLLELPDGTSVPMLNNTTGRLELKRHWGNRPYSPIARIETDSTGKQYYVHADGTMTQTVMMYRPDLGRYDPAIMVAGPSLPEGAAIDEETLDGARGATKAKK